MISDELQKIFSTNLRAARIRANLSQLKLAEKANLSVGYICDLESGRRWGTPETFSKLSNALDMHPYELLLPMVAQDNGKSAEYQEFQKQYVGVLHRLLQQNVTNAVNKAISDTLVDILHC
ncbi:helix-turn-helix transcriptional regulator [uncultured Treponema sp.]|uniref:helix-turn-helix domain-containing protein n=1 Tax=uncultured Treponema sp. TaxID=162155 RepID=UPI0025D0A9BD|nr:helix-turn-helix transcriptional regulator [uncultured Treponema sp.]